MKLSAFVITKDEVHYLEQCLRSLSDFDEILVFDTGSADYRGVEQLIGQINLPITLSSLPFKDYQWRGNFDFGAARNKALSACTGDIVMYIDSDERLVSNNIRAYFEEVKSDGYTFSILNPHTFLVRTPALSEGIFTRAVKNDDRFHFINPLHENLTWSLKQARAENVFVPKDVARIVHLGYDISRKKMMKKVKRNAALTFEMLKANPADAETWVAMATLHAWLGNGGEYVACLEQALGLGLMPVYERWLEGQLNDYKRNKPF